MHSKPNGNITRIVLVPPIRALYSHPAGVGRVGAARQPLAPWRHYYPVLLRAASRGEDVTALGQAFERLRVVRTALIFVHDRRR